tara:strand:+ start:1205 stop:1513 length:309 start_codon:yes stop_codon:yes gene_type:complete
MYKLRRIYRTKPGEATNVAKLVFKQAKMYKDAGHRGDFTVSYNGYTLPGEQNIVVLEWQQDSIMSPSRPGNNIPKEIMEAGAKYRPFLESQHIEFYEMIDSE